MAPAFAENCWEFLHWDAQSEPPLELEPYNKNLKGRRQLAMAYKGTIFHQGYPIPVDVLPLSENKVQNCAVYEDGLLRVVAVISIPSKNSIEETDAGKLRDWVLEHFQKTEEWKEFERMVPARLRRRVMVAKGAKTVNFIP